MSPGHYRACGIASTQGPSITCSLANWKTQWGLRKTNSCPLTRLRAFLHQGRLGIQMSCVFTSVMLASKAALHTLGWVQGKVIWSCCMGNTAGGLETQHSLMHEHHRDPRHAHSARGGNTAFHLLFPQRKHSQPQKQAQKSRLGTFHGKTLLPLPTCLLHWEMSPPNKSGWRDVCPSSPAHSWVCLLARWHPAESCNSYSSGAEGLVSAPIGKDIKTWAFLPRTGAKRTVWVKGLLNKASGDFFFPLLFQLNRND